MLPGRLGVLPRSPTTPPLLGLSAHAVSDRRVIKSFPVHDKVLRFGTGCAGEGGIWNAGHMTFLTPHPWSRLG